jgi:glycosyltransferase involved in cell wall biosynthesis
MEYRQYLTMGIPSQAIELVPNGIDLEMSHQTGDGSEVRRRLGIPADRPVVGYLGRLHPIKGVDFLLDSFKLVLAAQPDTLLLLVGPDDGSRPALQAQINQSGLNEAVLFTGFIGSPSEKAALYRAMDIYVLPSRYEIFGITLLEALQNQTPVITTDRCGLADMIQTQQIGAVIPFGEVNRLAEAILASLAQPEVARRQARQGNLYITENYSWDSVARRWEEAYHRTLKRATIRF